MVTTIGTINSLGSNCIPQYPDYRIFKEVPYQVVTHRQRVFRGPFLLTGELGKYPITYN